MSSITHSGTVALIGRPNVGKSTLLNCLLDKKISITSSKPQTTRWQILGIKTIDRAQIIYIDTPGLHQAKKYAMNRYMNRIAHSVLLDADIVIFVIDVKTWTEEDELVLKKLQEVNKPVIVAMNKVDLLKDKTQLLPVIDRLQQCYSFTHIIPISALKVDNIISLEQEIIALLPEGPELYPDHQITDKSIRFQIAESIREKIIQTTQQELPYTTTVEIEQLEQTDQLATIHAIIWVERSGQKIIIIGKQGEQLKKIGSLARRDIQTLLHQKVFLRLWVKVKKRWTDDERALKSLGYE